MLNFNNHLVNGTQAVVVYAGYSPNNLILFVQTNTCDNKSQRQRPKHANEISASAAWPALFPLGVARTSKDQGRTPAHSFLWCNWENGFLDDL